jgi:MarR family transcriptional regulator, lower aerobic nicotinate degradation pathway regulator
MRRVRTERIGQLLAVAAGAAQALAEERLGPLGLSPRGWGVLSTLVESGPLTQIELAAATATDRTAMVYLLDELEERELVERRRNLDDRRSFVIHLTPSGRRLREQAAAAVAEQTKTLLRPLSASERRQLIDLLTKVADHWQELHEVDVARPAQALRALNRLADTAEPARRPPSGRTKRADARGR